MMFFVKTVFVMRVNNQANLPAAEFAIITQEMAGPQNLQQLIAWASDKRSFLQPAVIVEVIVQDEFNHDVVVPYRDGLTLVYDVT
jgi:hypothetical protein